VYVCRQPGCALHWGVKFEPISWFIFHPIFISNGGMVGSLSVKSGFIIEFIFDNLPTLQIWGEKK
jgi:hypothetical protein